MNYELALTVQKTILPKGRMTRASILENKHLLETGRDHERLGFGVSLLRAWVISNDHVAIYIFSGHEPLVGVGGTGMGWDV